MRKLVGRKFALTLSGYFQKANIKGKKHLRSNRHNFESEIYH